MGDNLRDFLEKYLKLVLSRVADTKAGLMRMNRAIPQHFKFQVPQQINLVKISPRKAYNTGYNGEVVVQLDGAIEPKHLQQLSVKQCLVNYPSKHILGILRPAYPQPIIDMLSEHHKSKFNINLNIYIINNNYLHYHITNWHNQTNRQGRVSQFLNLKRFNLTKAKVNIIKYNTNENKKQKIKKKIKK